MAERDPFDLVEMSPGAQPPAGFGDRVLVGLALLALLGGAVIAVANFIPDADQVAQASIAPSAEPSRPPPPPTPAPPRTATIQDPDVTISPPEQWYGFDGWIRASADLVVHRDRYVESAEVGVLKQGDVAYASSNGEPDSEQGWLYLSDESGWVVTVASGAALARRYEYPRFQSSGWIDALSAGPDGFLAMMTPSGLDQNGPPRPVVSTNGTRWRSAAASAFDGQWVGAIAHGPSGWLAATSVSDERVERIILWGSSDGLSWSRLGMLSDEEDVYVEQLIGSETGYLLQTQAHRGVSTQWLSTDGLTWTESAVPAPQYGMSGYRRVAPVAGGFYMWGDGGDTAFSADGLTWESAGKIAPDGLSLHMADLNGRAFAIDLDRRTLVPRVWSGFMARGRLGWQRLEQSEQYFAGAVVTQLVSDGRSLYAFGWDRLTEEPVVWTGDGVGWSRSVLPEAFGGLPTRAAAGPNGVVAIGYRRTLRGDNPIAWHRTASGGWLPEPDPMLAVAADPAGDACPALPADLLEYSVVDTAAVVACHGDESITLEGLSVKCDGCAWSQDGDPQPAWLMNPFAHVLYMTPIATNSGWQTTLILGPSLNLDPGWVDHRLRITGHFDDPAAATCHQNVTADTVEWWSGQGPVINQCRQTFVVTDVTVLPGP